MQIKNAVIAATAMLFATSLQAHEPARDTSATVTQNTITTTKLLFLLT